MLTCIVEYVDRYNDRKGKYIYSRKMQGRHLGARELIGDIELVNIKPTSAVPKVW